MNKTLLTLSTAAALMISGCASHEAEVKEHKAAAAHGTSHEKHWDYAENGPVHWGEFSKTCAEGRSQSPINIVSAETVTLNQDYTLTLAEDVATTAKVIDNGHSIKVTPAKGGSITLNGEQFNLLQFHFHGHSENTVDGKQYDMVAHLVHQNPETKQLAVVAVFFEEGENNALLDNILGGVGAADIDLNPKDILPADTAHYYHFSGSLTTPPCSENVQWYVLKQPAPASKEQIDAFRKFYVDNYRPVQALNDRVVESN
jgi:carbonic anhydrase